MQNYKRLIVWQKADELAFEIYKITNTFPKTELFGLISQLRRAALSVVLNIVEGYGRKSNTELSRFIDISLGSLAETEYLLEFSGRLNYISHNDTDRLTKLASEVSKLLWKFKRSL
ncbi:MAG: four helix bundle protein [Thermodesulfovibrionales bacterium]